MNISIIQFQKEQHYLLRELRLDSPDDLAEAQKSLVSPSVWIVPITALQKLARFSDLIDDRGKKHKAMELSRVLLHEGRITMVDGGFSTAGKLCQSVKKFLEKLDGSKPRLFIIGATEEIFSKLKNDAENNTSGMDALEMGDKTDQPAIGIMAHLDQAKEPEQLRNEYVGNSLEAKEVRQRIIYAANVRDEVLIMGDTGTGKEIVANQIHRLSSRRNAQFIAVNCGALTHSLFESEIFGYKAGAFTGATKNRLGFWRAAEGGTLFLDEIGELALDLQAKVLRALQDGKIRPVGEDKEITVNTRVIAATNRDLYSMVQDGKFRKDLYYRLRGFLIRTPSLKEHPEDIPLIAVALWKKIVGNNFTELPQDILLELRNTAWPGNVRELKMVLVQLHGYFGKKKPLEVKHLRAVLEEQGQRVPQSPPITVEVLPTMSAPLAAFRQLRRTYETVRAAEHLLQPMIHGDTEIADASGLRDKTQWLLGELDSFCRYPGRFTPETFENLNKVRLYLSKLNGDLSIDAIRVSFTDKGHQIFETTISSLLQDMESVLANI